MKLRVELAPDAREQVAELGRWWRKNRPANRGLFRQELRAAIAMLSERPEAGPVAENAGAGVHKLLLLRSQYYVYYRIDSADRRVDVLLVWHTSREKTARL